MTDFVPSSRFAPPEKLEVTLVSNSAVAPASREWDGQAAACVAAMEQPHPGAWRITGTADSGTTSLVIDSVMARIASGVSPDKILVLATSKESGALLRKQFALLLPQVGFASETPLVRSIHSFAFSLVRTARLRAPDAADDAVLGKTPRLMTGAEQDLIIRELLELQAETGAQIWPERVRDALLLVGFARQLRDFLLRAQERGLGAEELRSLGRQHGRDMWVAAGEFLEEYEKIARLEGAQRYNASELVVSALKHLRRDDEFRTEIQSSIDSIFIDDAQSLDPTSGELVDVITKSAACAVLAGNPEHSVFHFRGSSPEFFRQWPAEHQVVLDRRRHAPAQQVRFAESAAMEQLVVADTVRRAHLIDGLAWRDIAVIVRSSGSIPVVRRALLSAGVPVSLEPTAMVLAEQRLVSALLLALAALERPLPAPQLEELVLGPIGGADAVTLRRLLRGLKQAEMKQGGVRRAAQVLADVLASATAPSEEMIAFLTPRELDILQRITGVLGAGRKALAQGASVELVLWEVWEATGLSDRLSAASLRGGAVGSQADIDLDAVMALFDLAGDFVERQPQAPLARFVDMVSSQEVPSGTRDRRGYDTDAVSILTAHGCFGQRWPLVVVHGVQEGVWPALAETGSLFGQEDLVELHDRGIDPNIITSLTADKIAEERRLFGLACSRATQQLVVTAVLLPESEEVEEPSRFLTEFAAQPDVAVFHDGVAESFAKAEIDTGQLSFPRLLSGPSIIAELRRALEDPSTSPEKKSEAARQLARLAQAGVFGAHPSQWWGLAEPSSHESVLRTVPSVRLSPSKIESALACPLRTALSSYGEEDDSPLHLFKGILIHAAAEACAAGVPQPEIRENVMDAFRANTDFPAWQRESAHAEFADLVDRTMNWVAGRQDALVGAEVHVDVTVSALIDGTPIDIYGRMDRLERDPDDKFLIIDLKTGKSQVSGDDVKTHPQLFAYQLALACGELVDGSVTGRTASIDDSVLGGGRLVYPAVGKKEPGKREQPAKTAEELADFAASLPQVVQSMTGPQFEATVGEGCDNCILRTMCPAQPEGKALTLV